MANWSRMCLQVCDGYFVKYFASVVALLVYGAPIYFQDPSKRGTQDDITQDYIRAMRLLQNTSKWVAPRKLPAMLHGLSCLVIAFLMMCLNKVWGGCRGIGDLILVYKRITSLAGHTSRVAELLEQVCTFLCV